MNNVGSLLQSFRDGIVLATDEYMQLEDTGLIRRQFFGTRLVLTIRGRMALSKYNKTNSSTFI